MNQLALLPDAKPIRPYPPVIHREAQLEVIGAHTFRWSLKRWWRGGPYVCWIMLNPSIADANMDDPTMREVIYFTHAWGYAGAVVVNQYPIVTPVVENCRRWSDRSNSDVQAVLFRNCEVISEAVHGAEKTIVAWGALPWDAAWTDVIAFEAQCPNDKGEPTRELFCIGTTESGAPKHPMARGRHRVPRDQQPMVWRGLQC